MASVKMNKVSSGSVIIVFTIDLYRDRVAEFPDVSSALTRALRESHRDFLVEGYHIVPASVQARLGRSKQKSFIELKHLNHLNWF